MAAFVLRIFHTAFAAGMRGYFCKLYGRPHLLAHTVMYLQYQAAGNGQVHEGNRYGEDLFHDDAAKIDTKVQIGNKGMLNEATKINLQSSKKYQF